MEENNQNQPTAPAAPAPNTKTCNCLPLIIILAILAIAGFAFGGYELYQNIKLKDSAKTTETECTPEEKEDDNSNNNGQWIDCMPPLSTAEAERCEKAKEEGYPYIAY